GGVVAHFEWNRPQAQFVLNANGHNNPFEVVLEFLSKANVIELTPIGYVEGGAADGDDDGDEEEAAPSEPEEADDGDAAPETQGRLTTPVFPSGEGDRNALPVQLADDGHRLTVS